MKDIVAIGLFDNFAEHINLIRLVSSINRSEGLFVYDQHSKLVITLVTLGAPRGTYYE